MQKVEENDQISRNRCNLMLLHVSGSIVNARPRGSDNTSTDIPYMQLLQISDLIVSDITCNCTKYVSVDLLLMLQAVAFTIDPLLSFNVNLSRYKPNIEISV